MFINDMSVTLIINVLIFPGAHNPRVSAGSEATLRGSVRLCGGLGEDGARGGPDTLTTTGQLRLY